MTSKRGFTLIELLVVIGIVAVITSILLPVFQSVRRDAHRSVSASNLHQCWVALQIYCDDYGLSPSQIPTWANANNALSGMPTCDPQDTWRTNCSQNFGSPLIGSYAYSRSDEMLSIGPGMPQNDWADLTQIYFNPVLLTSIYYADPVAQAFHGAAAPSGDLPNEIEEPNRLLGVYLDGSVKTKQTQYPQGPKLFTVMDWSTVLASQSYNGAA
jgi:prepilin-type N-terminal cleavage/methylation domain-containing protein